MHGNIHCHLATLVLLAGSEIVNLCNYLVCLSYLCFLLGHRFCTTVFDWLLVTLFPLSDGGVLVAVTTCAVLRGGGYYLVPAVECGLPFGLVSFFAGLFT
jgi:hypothetical protein